MGQTVKGSKTWRTSGFDVVCLVAGWIASREVLFFSLAAPGLLFLGFYTLPALALLFFIWLARWLFSGRLTLRTPLDWPLLGLVVMLPVSMGVSTDLTRSQPKLLGIILGAAAFYCVVNTTLRARDVERWAIILTILSVCVSVLALVSTEWSHKFPSLLPLYDNLPRLRIDIPGTLTGRIGSNEVGGTIALFLPFITSLAIIERKQLPWARWIVRLLLGLTSAFLSFTLLLTQSRSGIVGAVVGLVVLAVMKTHWILVILPLLFWRVQQIIQARGTSWLINWLLVMPAQKSYYGRVDVWLRALYVIRHAPLTGTGLNTFTQITHARFPYYHLPPGFPVTHAHNNLLQVGVDLGLPGLVCYLALLSLFVWMAWTIYRKGKGLSQAIAAGSLSSMVAHQVFGLTDAIALGAKPGIFLWIILGLVCGMYVNFSWQTPTDHARGKPEVDYLDP